MIDLGDRVMCPAVRAEAVRTRLKVRLEDRLEHQHQGGLDGPVSRGWDAQGPELPSGLWDEPLPHGQGSKLPRPEIISQLGEKPVAGGDGARLHTIDAG